MPAATSTQTVLVTGATGFTGGALANALLGRGHSVRALVRPSNPLKNKRAGLTAYFGDLTDARSVDQAVEGVDVIYHIAAAYRESLPESAMFAANVAGTRNVMEAARRYGVKRIVHCSTAGVHGHIDNPPADETAPLKPGDAYQRTKLEGERLVQRYIEKGLPATIFRPVGLYGPGDLRFLKLFKSIKKGAFIMFGDGSPLYQLSFIDDVVKMVIACGEHPRAVGETYLVCGPRAVTLNELVKKIADAVDAAPPKIRLPFWTLYSAAAACEAVCWPLRINPPLYRRRADWFRKSRDFVHTKITEQLGVGPAVGLEEGLKKTADWYRSEGLL